MVACMCAEHNIFYAIKKPFYLHKNQKYYVNNLDCAIRKNPYLSPFVSIG